MKWLTPQEVFNKSYAHVLAQGAPCVNNHGGCCYRSPDMQRSCGVGGLFPDEMYYPDWDKGLGTAVDSTEGGIKRDKMRAALKAGHIDLEDPDVRKVLVACQSCHDRAAMRYKLNNNFIEEYKSFMQEAAAKLGLGE